MGGITLRQDPTEALPALCECESRNPKRPDSNQTEAAGAPDAWGPDLPVDPQMYEHLPVAWREVVCLGFLGFRVWGV